MENPATNWPRLRTSGTRAIGQLVDLSADLPRPTNYYVGAGNLLDRPPRELLAFFEHRDLSADRVWAHHRFVLVVCLECPGTVIVDGSIHAVQPRDAVLVFPYQTHHYARFQGGRVCWLFVTFELDAEDPIAALRGQRLRMGDEELGLLRNVVGCYEAYAAGQHARASESGAWTALLLSRLLSSERSSDPALATSDEEMGRIRGVVRDIHRNLGRRVTVEQLSARAHVSASHLRRLFTRRMGTSIGAYVRRARVNKASGLLHRSDMTIGEVGSACGFASLFAFSRTFKHAMGQSPKAYRNRLTRR